MANKLKTQKVIKLRTKYFDYVYKKYIYNVFTELNRPKHEQIILGMEEHNTNKEILKKYLSENSLNEAEKDIFKPWENEIFGDMHVIEIDKGMGFIYCEQTDQVYHVHVFDKEHARTLKAIPFNIKFHGSIFSIYGKQYIDLVININSHSDRSLKYSEELYEHIYQLVLKGNEMMSKCRIFTYRDLKKDKFSNIFLDYIGPLSPLSMDPDELDSCLKLAMMVWDEDAIPDINLDILDEEAVTFLRERKKKYFSQVKKYLVDFDVRYDKVGFELITKSADLK